MNYSIENIKNQKVPQIRFKGFSGEWDIKKFGECVLIQRGGSPRPIENFITNNENGINWIKIGDVSTGSRYITQTKEKIIPEGEKNSRKVLIGDLILSNSMSFGRPYIMAIEGCIHDGWLLIRDEKKIFNLEYLLQLLSSEHMINQYKALASGGVVINLNSELVQSTNVFIPNKKEQTKIGDYFQQLDKLIEQKEKKYKKLKQFKKAMLCKMFPKNGANTPEIRFRGFSGEWEEKNLGELCTLITKGTTPLDKSNNGSVNFIKIENINGLSGKITITTKISNEEHENYLKRSQLKEDDVLFSIAGTLGRITIIQKDVLPANTNQALAIIRLKEASINYIATYLKGKAVKEFVKKNPTIGAQPNLSLEQIGKIEILLPTIEEQTKIGNYFQRLDSQIELQLQEIEKFRNIKKALLAKMFV